MKFPAIHRNGTSVSILLDMWMDAATKIDATIEAVEAARPNSRDYNVISRDAYKHASKDYEALLNKLIDVNNEITELCEYLHGKMTNPRG